MKKFHFLFLFFTLIFSLLLIPVSVSASVLPTTIFSDSFTEETTKDDVPGWVDGGGDNINDTHVTNGTGRTGSPTTYNARIRDGGYITNTISTLGYNNIFLKYYWRGDNHGDGNSDNLKVFWKKTSDSIFSLINTHQLDGNEVWSPEVQISLPSLANNTSIDIKFLGDSNANDEEARVDDISVTGDIISICSSNSDCDDGNSCTTDVCVNPNMPNAVCSHTNNPVDGVWTYSEWGSCSNICGGGNQTCETLSCSATCGGTCGEPIISRTCNTQACELAGTCPNTCGYAGGTVPNGQGGHITCPMTDSCPTEGFCPTTCGYTGGTVPDGQGGVKECSATSVCPIEEQCPTQCGYGGGLVPDGLGGNKTCEATTACPINGGWSGWTPTNPGTCGITVEQTRACTNPAPANGGAMCEGSNSRAVTNDPCPPPIPEPVNGGWSDWSPLVCPTSPGSLESTQTRTCTNPIPTNGGATCEGSSTQICQAVPPTPIPPPPPTNNGGGNGPIVGSLGLGGGFVLGASTSKEEVLGESCTVYIDKFMSIGKKNDPEQVKKLQEFLNEYLDLNIPVTGFFGPITFNAVKQFQLKENKEILFPWVSLGLHDSENNPTGNVYKTTQWKINMIKCPSLNLPLPELM